MPNLISLTTDFGTRDGFAGTMHGVILRLAPGVTIVDLSHEIAPQDIGQGAFVLETSLPYFPEEAVHVCVVDPGVGSARRAIVVAIGPTLLVAPDNGVLAPAITALERLRGVTARVYELDRPAYWLAQVSNTFHGRDIFAPVAAHLANGVAPQELGSPLAGHVRLDLPQATREADGTVAGHIRYVDRFGNLITDIPASLLAGLDLSRVRVQLGARVLEGVKHAYAEVAVGDLVAVMGSSGGLEIARRDGDAARALGARVGDPVRVEG